MFWSIFVEINKIIMFKDLKLTISERSWEFHREKKIQLVLNEKNREERFRFDGNNFFCSNHWNGPIISKICFSPLNKLHTAKKKFWVFWRIFEEVDKKMLRWTKKLLSQKEVKNSTERNFFNELENRKVFKVLI